MMTSGYAQRSHRNRIESRRDLRECTFVRALPNSLGDCFDFGHLGRLPHLSLQFWKTFQPSNIVGWYAPVLQLMRSARENTLIAAGTGVPARR